MTAGPVRPNQPWLSRTAHAHDGTGEASRMVPRSLLLEQDQLVPSTAPLTCGPRSGSPAMYARNCTLFFLLAHYWWY
jgi:hypothetical protein